LNLVGRGLELEEFSYDFAREIYPLDYPLTTACLNAVVCSTRSG
jgi:hypothetical protein